MQLYKELYKEIFIKSNDNDPRVGDGELANIGGVN